MRLVRVGFKKGKCVSPFFSVALEVETSSKKRIEQIDFSFQILLYYNINFLFNIICEDKQV